MNFMNRDQLLRRIEQPNTNLTPGETKRAMQILLEMINELEARVESLRGSGSSKGSEAKDKASGTRGRGRPRKSNAEGSNEEGSA